MSALAEFKHDELTIEIYQDHGVESPLDYVGDALEINVDDLRRFTSAGFTIEEAAKVHLHKEIGEFIGWEFYPILHDNYVTREASFYNATHIIAIDAESVPNAQALVDEWIQWASGEVYTASITYRGVPVDCVGGLYGLEAVQDEIQVMLSEWLEDIEWSYNRKKEEAEQLAKKHKDACCSELYADFSNMLEDIVTSETHKHKAVQAAVDATKEWLEDLYL